MIIPYVFCIVNALEVNESCLNFLLVSSVFMRTTKSNYSKVSPLHSSNF